MKKWFFDFDIADKPLYCETYYDKDLEKRMVILESGEKIERPLVDMYDTELECVNEKLKEIKMVSDSNTQLTFKDRHIICMFHKRRLQFEKLGL